VILKAIIPIQETPREFCSHFVIRTNHDSCFSGNGGKGDVDKFWSGAAGKVVKCTQRKLSSGKSVGGNTCKTSGRTDVDAFTFADRDFVVFKDGLGTIVNGKPTQRTVKKGRWVKFESTMTVYCESKNGAPYCHFNSDLIV